MVLGETPQLPITALLGELRDIETLYDTSCTYLLIRTIDATDKRHLYKFRLIRCCDCYRIPGCGIIFKDWLH